MMITSVTSNTDGIRISAWSHDDRGNIIRITLRDDQAILLASDLLNAWYERQRVEISGKSGIMEMSTKSPDGVDPK